MALCRHCGRTLGARGAPFTACPACAGSPLCDVCGHPRADHGQVFVGGVAPGCRRRVGDFQALASWPCDCPGFRPLEGRLADATFARRPAGEGGEERPLRLA